MLKKTSIINFIRDSKNSDSKDNLNVTEMNLLTPTHTDIEELILEEDSC